MLATRQCFWIGRAYGDTGVTTNDRYDDIARLGGIPNDLGDEGRCTDDIQSRYTEKPGVAVSTDG
jgi:hypothetical protein